MGDLSQALKGIRVLDFGAVGVGPICAMIPGHFGAQVIKIESEVRPDPLRTSQPKPPGADPAGLNDSGYFNNFNTNKLSIALDLTNEDARQVARDLVAVSDVVIENFRPGTLEKWGLGYEDLCRIKSDIILVQLPMAGSTGPHRDFAGYGRTITPVAGLHYMTGFPDRLPVGIGTNYADFVVNPGHGVVGLLAALHYRDRTSEGQVVEVAQIESTAAVIGPALLDCAANGTLAERTGNRLPHAAPHGAYPCQGEERWIAIGVFEETEWAALCEVAGHPEWGDDERFSSFEARKHNEDALDACLAEWSRGQVAEDVMDALQGAGVAAGVVQNAQDLLERDAHLKAREYYAYLDHAINGRTAHDTPGVRLSSTPSRVHSAAPLLGEHSHHVLTEILGLDDDAITELVIAGAIH